jgi:hypothetical protein
MDRIDITNQEGSAFGGAGGRAQSPNRAASRSGLATLSESGGQDNSPRTVTMWDYTRGLTFIFHGQPTYGTAQVPGSDRGFVEYAINQNPATWDNVEAGRIDEMPVRMARFRTENDSIDLYLAPLAPVAAIHGASGLNTPITGSLWLLGEGIPQTIHDQSDFKADGAKVWIYRLAPTNYLYRLEATADAAQAAGRASAWIRVADDPLTGFARSGFGTSDLLVAARAQPSRTTAARWTDFAMTPLLAPARRGGELSLIWETYELTPRDGRATYEIALTIQRERSSGGRVLAEVASALASAIGVDRVGDRATYRFDRTAAHAPAIVDHVTVSLRETPPGTYRVTLDITDRATGKKASRTTLITIGG